MKKLLCLAIIFATIGAQAQSDTTSVQSKSSSNSSSKSTQLTVKGIYGSNAIYSEGKSGGIGLGLGAKIPVKKGAVDASLEFTNSAAKNNLGIQALYDWNFKLIEDDKIKIEGYAGVGLGFGRIFNNEDYFWKGVEDYNYYGILFNAGVDFQPVSKDFLIFTEINPGLVNVPGWGQSSQMPFEFSLGMRFNLK